jgi:hypothetical protein
MKASLSMSATQPCAAVSLLSPRVRAKKEKVVGQDPALFERASPLPKSGVLPLHQRSERDFDIDPHADDT